MQTAAGLAAAHAQGLVHRDVKPANILLENGIERVKLTDFGLARAAADAGMTQSGIVAGTPHYMAPEQARGEATDHRADLFSLGSTLYAMCTGLPPFRAETPVAVLRRVSDDVPRPIRQLNPEIPDWLEAIVERLHAKDPADRFASASELADLLGQCLAHVQEPLTVAAGLGADPGEGEVAAGPTGIASVWSGGRIRSAWPVVLGPAFAIRCAAGCRDPSRPSSRPSSRPRWPPPSPRRADPPVARGTWRMRPKTRSARPGNGPGRSRPTSIGRPIPRAKIGSPRWSGTWPIGPGRLERELAPGRDAAPVLRAVPSRPDPDDPDRR